MLTGVDEGTPYRTDIIPLSIAGEIAAWVTGRKTYGLHAGYVCHRNASRMNLDEKYGRPAVFANHRCGKSLAEAMDFKHVDKVAKFVDLIINHPPGTPESDKEEEARFSIADLLSGKVIAVSDGTNPPF